MIDIDKKIEKMKKGQPVVDTQGHFMYYVENTTEIKWLINQLVACRESYATLYQRMKPGIEQSIKEACKEKAMEWWDEQIKTHNQPNLYIMSKNSLKKAIDEAEGE